MQSQNFAAASEQAQESGNQIVAQTIATALGFQEAMRSFAKARMMFYCAGVVFGLGVAQATLASLNAAKKE